ncbi:MAG: hypothetical protein GX595_05755 [Lentisphaerae bacterium]|nr:hypothetical protein [Lentisphaerota bacterium]
MLTRREIEKHLTRVFPGITRNAANMSARLAVRCDDHERLAVAEWEARRRLDAKANAEDLSHVAPEAMGRPRRGGQRLLDPTGERAVANVMKRAA